MGEGLIRALVAAKGLKAGDIIRDNDPRMPTRELRIDDFVAIGQSVYARAGWAKGNATRRVEIRLDRIHTDGKPRKSGFSLARSDASNNP
jgi:hypothetical protein